MNKPLSQDELRDLQRRLSLLSPHHVQEAYRRAHKQCQMDEDVLPMAAAVQELVTAWKTMRNWKRRRPPPERLIVKSGAEAPLCCTTTDDPDITRAEGPTAVEDVGKQSEPSSLPRGSHNIIFSTKFRFAFNHFQESKSPSCTPMPHNGIM